MRKIALGAMAFVIIADIVITYFLLFAPQGIALLFLRFYVWLLSIGISLFGLWAFVKLTTVPRPKPLPEVEKEFEEELKRLYKEWREKQ